MGTLIQDNKRTYNSWLGARYRCESDKHPKWEDYGGRGIKMCERWRNSFPAFLEDMGPRPEGLELDRENNDGDYEKSNCRWVTRSANTLNRKRRSPKARVIRCKKPSQADQQRLARLERVDAKYADKLSKLRSKIAALEEVVRAERAAIIEKIRPEFRPAK